MTAPAQTLSPIIDPPTEGPARPSARPPRRGGRAAGLALTLLALAAVSACQTRPKPSDAAATRTGGAAPVEQGRTGAGGADGASRPLPPLQSGGDVGSAPGADRSVPLARDAGVDPRSPLEAVGDRVFFETDQYTLTAEAQAILGRQAAWLSANPGVRILVAGNCDERGTREYNLALGARRANAARDYLVSLGIAASRIDTVSYGKERPIDPRPSAEGWAVNRNAHTTVLSGASS